MKSYLHLLVIGVALCSQAYAAEGAKAQYYDSNGQPVGPVVSVPDCKSCKVEKTGEHSYTVTVPKDVKKKADEEVKKQCGGQACAGAAK